MSEVTDEIVRAFGRALVSSGLTLEEAIGAIVVAQAAHRSWPIEQARDWVADAAKTAQATPETLATFAYLAIH